MPPAPGTARARLAAVARRWRRLADRAAEHFVQPVEHDPGPMTATEIGDLATRVVAAFTPRLSPG